MHQPLSGADHSLNIFHSEHDWETVESLADGDWKLGHSGGSSRGLLEPHRLVLSMGPKQWS